jgi:hypothetical protein
MGRRRLLLLLPRLSVIPNERIKWMAASATDCVIEEYVHTQAVHKPYGQVRCLITAVYRNTATTPPPAERQREREVEIYRLDRAARR